MINLRNINLKYGDRVLFNDISAAIREGDRVGLIGRNGAGKTTLLRVISGEISSDNGAVDIPLSMTMGVLSQTLHCDEEETVLSEAKKAFEKIIKLEEELEDVNQQLGSRTDYESDAYALLIDRVSELSSQLTYDGIETLEAKCVKVLKGLGFNDLNVHKKISTFSGGWKMRVELAKLLLTEPDILLLDEPTNHLDIESIIWLENYINSYSGIVIVISHDEEFLENVCNRILEVELGRLFDFKLSYSKFLVEKEQQKKILNATIENQQKEIAQKEKLIEKFRAKANKAKFAQSLIKQLDKMDVLEGITEDTKAMKLRFPPAPRSGQVLVEAKQVSKSYGPLNVLQSIDLKIERGQKISFVGQNGQGKSTLAKLITETIDPTDGAINLGHNVSVGYFAQDQSESLDRSMTVEDTLFDACPPELSSQVRSILGAFLFSGEDVDKKVSVLSGGERSRLSLACLIVQKNNFLILDEPTNHLDIISKRRLKESLMQFDGTLLVVSHDRHFLEGLTDITYEFRDKKIHEYLGDINYFLETREVDNFREVEKRDVTKAKDKPAANNHKDKPAPIDKDLKKKLRDVEKEIEKIETKIAKLEEKMSEPDYYNSPEYIETSKKHKALGASLEAAMESWESLVEQS